MEQAASYGDTWFEVYDEYTSNLGLDPSAAITFLAGLAGVGPVLELGIGTGRIALRLAAVGVSVHGIEASEQMISKLKQKAGNDLITIYKADYTDFHLNQKYPLIFAPFNAVMMVPERHDQINCFKCVADALDLGGRFVVEADLPDFSDFVDNTRIHLVRSTVSTLELQVTLHKSVAQQLVAHHLWLEDRSLRMRNVVMRYAGPSELDLMANVAGLLLESRVADWAGTPFTSKSRSHVSTYVKG